MTPHFRSPLRARIEARISVALMAFVMSVAVVTALVYLLSRKPSHQKTNRKPIQVYCAAGLKIPVDAIAREYEKTYGVPIQLSYGGSQTLLASFEVTRRGDLYLPADESYLALAAQRNLIAETIPLARMRAVVGVRKGNPKRIQGLEDLFRNEVSLAQANPDAAAIGSLVRKALGPSAWERLAQRTTVFKPTVNDVANDLKLGTVDAGFLWDALLPQYPELESISLPALSQATAQVAVAVLQVCQQPAAALHFARYLSASDRGLTHFRQHGFAVVDGDPWAEHPELRVLAGAMLRPAIEETLSRFEKREGVRVLRVYNGCGILVAQMLAGDRPDAYFACDKSFMRQVQDLFPAPEDVARNELVIVVPKGNPRRITTLADLGQLGLRVGLAHEQQSALGALTRNLLFTNRVYFQVRSNVVVESPTGDFLVNQLRTKSLDAIVVYVSNVAAVRTDLDVVPLGGVRGEAVQPLAVSSATRFKQLATRLTQALRSAESRERFEAVGFQWQPNTPPD